MNRLSEYVKKIYEKLKALRMRTKIAYGTIIVGVILAVIFYSMYSSQNKWGLLFSKFDATTGKTITDKLTADKEEFKVDGDAIYVLKDRADELKIKYAPDLGSASVGFEIFDNQSQFSTDTEDVFNVKKQRAMQGELERMIKSIPQVEDARVLIAVPEQSAFGMSEEKGSVSVYLTLKSGAKLDQKQANAIIILISGSIKNVPRENVYITDNLLQSYEYDQAGSGDQGVEPETQQSMKTNFETKLEKAVRTLLGPALGADKINVKVSADMNFDSKEKTTVTYDPNKVLLSSSNVVEGKLGNIDGVTTSPVDNNMVNYYVTTAGAIEKGVTKIDSQANYQVGSTTEKVLYAPGEVTRMTATVMYYGGTLNANQIREIQNAVINAVGMKTDRGAAPGDSVSVVAMAFDKDAKAAADAAKAALEAEAAKAAQLKFYQMIAAAAGGLVLLIIFIIVMLRRRSKKRKMAPPSSLDVVIGENLLERPPVVPYVPLDLDVENESSGLEKDIKKYAEDKPDQVVDIIKSWMAEDEG